VTIAYRGGLRETLTHGAPHAPARGGALTGAADRGDRRLPARLRLTRDAAGRMPSGGVYRRGYDRHHNVRTVVHPDGTTHTYHSRPGAARSQPQRGCPPRSATTPAAAYNRCFRECNPPRPWGRSGP
jgi:hypothetical protein